MSEHDGPGLAPAADGDLGLDGHRGSELPGYRPGLEGSPGHPPSRDGATPQPAEELCRDTPAV